MHRIALASWLTLPLLGACRGGDEAQGPAGYEDEDDVDLGDGAGVGDDGDDGGAAQGLDAQLVIGDWPQTPMEVAQQMITKYGDPDEVTESMLVWHANGDWLHTIVFRDEVQHDFPMPHTDLLQQFIAYDVPPELYDELALYDGSVMAERTKGVLSARCDKEGANYLALNLANEIVTGERTWQEARQFYGEQITLALAGQAGPYLQGLMFTPEREPVGDPDVSIIPAGGDDEGGAGGGGAGGGVGVRGDFP